MLIKPLVYVRFLDHCQDDSVSIKPIVCEVFGILKKEDKIAWYVCPWVCDYNLNDSNTDCYCILKSTMIEYRQIKTKGRTYGKKNESRHRRS